MKKNFYLNLQQQFVPHYCLHMQIIRQRKQLTTDNMKKLYDRLLLHPYSIIGPLSVGVNPLKKSSSSLIIKVVL